MKSVLVALAVLAVVLPASVQTAAPGPTLTVIDVPLHGERTLAAAEPRGRFDLVGLHWLGRGTVSFRTRRIGGGWSPWHAAAPEAEDRPDAGSAEAKRSGAWHLGSPWWVGASDRIAYRLHGDIRALRALLVASPTEHSTARTLSIASSPPMVSRAGWNADESIRRADPQYADALRFAVVHHTAGANDYTRAEAPAVVRAIELYHVQGNGWNDIGYNFLVDRFGTVYEGRYGGIDRNVVGAHALGFNTGSVGVAVIGTYTDAAPPAAGMDALAKLLAWRLDLAHVDPLSTLSVVSGGSERYQAGTTVTLRAVSGHRDTGLTACPGNALYAKLDDLAARVAAIGLPKLYEPLVSGQVGGFVRFQARLSSADPWTVTVDDATGAGVASGSGIGPTVDWTWDSAAAAQGDYTWQIASDGATPATGALSGGAVAATLAVTGAAADPLTISPNGDGVADSSTITYHTTAVATVGVTVLDASGATVGTLQQPVEQSPGEHSLGFDAAGLPDGAYAVQIDAGNAESNVTQTVGVLVTRTLGSAVLSPQSFSPNGDGRGDRLTVRFTLLEPAAVQLRILRDGHWVTTPFKGDLQAGRRSVTWDGSKRLGRLLDGSYTAEVDATDSVGTSAVTLPFVSDTRAPIVRILPGKPLRILVSEPAAVDVRVNGHVVRLEAVGGRPERVPWSGAATRLRAVAWDAAGNVSKPVLRG